MLPYNALEQLYKATLLYVYWQLNGKAKSNVARVDPTNAWLEKEIAWRRRVMCSTMGNDTFILDGQ